MIGQRQGLLGHHIHIAAGVIGNLDDHCIDCPEHRKL